MGPGQPKPTRKRNIKRKRRVVSDSSSSEEDSSSSSDASKTVTSPVRQPKPSENADADDEDKESSSSDASEDDSDTDDENVAISKPSSRPGPHEPPLQRDSPSPQPGVAIPPFIPPNAPEGEQVLKDKFRKFWMASIAEGFKDDLEEIRKEPNLGPSRLALLIESLASGADVFSSSSAGGCVNEMEVVLDQLP